MSSSVTLPNEAYNITWNGNINKSKFKIQAHKKQECNYKNPLDKGCWFEYLENTTYRYNYHTSILAMIFIIL